MIRKNKAELPVGDIWIDGGAPSGLCTAMFGRKPFAFPPESLFAFTPESGVKA